MGLADVGGREPVLAAIAEFDRVGRERFLEKYGFGAARAYWLVHDGRRYDSKAIIGAAHGYAQPALGPLKSADFVGGDSTVRRKLEELGFAVEVDDSESDPARPSSFLLTWKESGWHHSNISRMVQTFGQQGYVDEPWRIFAHRMAKPGDRVWVLKQGSGPKGLFGAGVITEPPRQMETGDDGKTRWMAPIRFFRFADPKLELLVDESQLKGLLSDRQIRAQASGYPLSDEQAEELEEILPSAGALAIVLSAAASDDEAFDPANIQDARQRIIRSIVQRRGQTGFREALIAAYDGRCAITGCAVLDVLEAAHIHPFLGSETNHVTNGLLLRADLHTLFDCRLISIDPDTLTVLVAPRLRGSDYAALHGVRLRDPRSTSQSPSRKALLGQREKARL